VGGSAQRRAVVEHVASRTPSSDGHTCPRIAVDGPDGSGKTTFAEELATALRSVGYPVVRVSLDDFHNVRATRYRQGRESPEGFWWDSFNYQRFRSDVLAPFAPGGSRLYRAVAHDLSTDTVLDAEPCTALPGTALIVDGLFLHRDELVDAWDLSVFLDVPFSVTAKRMALRDGTNPNPEHPSMRRYVEAQRIYFNACSPHQRTDILIDNQEFSTPRIIRG
jgi:uridine kinase